VPFTLAPAVAELEFRGELFRPSWTISLKDRTMIDLFNIPGLNGASRQFPLCFSGAGPKRATLVLGALPRAEALPTTTRQKKKTKGRR
jgi:hypothetical protein